jgi:hypothetical protein
MHAIGKGSGGRAASVGHLGLPAFQDGVVGVEAPASYGSHDGVRRLGDSDVRRKTVTRSIRLDCGGGRGGVGTLIMWRWIPDDPDDGSETL